MPFDTPTLPVLIARAQSDLDGATALRRSDAQVLARVQAGATYGLYGYLAWLARQILPDTCDDDMVPRHASMRPIPVRFDPTRARGYAHATGTPGARLLKDTLLQRVGGLRYRVVNEVDLHAAPTPVLVEAVTAGALGNAAPSTALTLVSPALGVASQLTVNADGLTGGVDEESMDAYRQRVLRSYRVVPHGGNGDDYETWALEVPGVTRAWCVRRWMGPGTVAVFFVRDGDDDPIPNAAQCAQVQAHIEAQQSVIPEVYALAPTQVAVAYRIKVTPDTVPVRAAVERALQALHAAEADLGAPMLISYIREAISGAEGERDHVLFEPAGDVVAGANELLTFGGVTWI